MTSRTDDAHKATTEAQCPEVGNVLAALMRDNSGLPPALLKYQLLTLDQVCTLAGIKKSKWYAGIKEGIFPPPQHFGKSSRWSTGAVLRALGYEI